MRWLSNICGLLALGLTATAGYLYVTADPGPPPPFVVSPTAFDLTLPPGDHDVVVHVANPAKLPRRIIGLNEG